MTFYEEMAAAALELLAEFGVPVVIKRESVAYFDPIIGKTLPGSTADYQGIAVLADYSLKESGTINQQNTLIQKGDKRITLAAGGLAIVPELSDKIVVTGDEYTIHNIKEVSPAGTPILYELQGRK